MKTLKEDTIYGRELTGTAKIAKMNMIITGDGHNNIRQMDSLSEKVDGEYNVVLTNYPFSQKTDYAAQYGLSTEDANPVFVKHVIEALANEGRAGVVVPEGFLFDTSSQHVTVRKYLLENCNLTGVIKLDGFVFRPYTGQPTSILIFEKGTPTNSVWFFDVQQDGFKKTSSKNGRPPIKDNDLILLRQLWDDKADSPQSFTVGIDTITKNGYKLSLNDYLASHSQADWVPLGGDEGLCDIQIGGTPSTSDPTCWGGKHPWVTIRDMQSMYVNETERTLTDKGVAKSSVKLLPKDTVLFSFKLTIGRVAIAERDLYTNEAIAGLTPKDDRVLSKYLYYILPRLSFRSYTQSAAKGGTLNKKKLESILIPLPPVKVQKKIVSALDAAEAKRLAHMEKIKEIRDTEQSLVDEVLAGSFE